MTNDITTLARDIDNILTGKGELTVEQAPWLMTVTEAELLKSRIDHARKLLSEYLED